MNQTLDAGKITLLLSFFNEYKTATQAAIDTQRDPECIWDDMEVLLNHSQPYLLMIKSVRGGYSFTLTPKGRIHVCKLAHNGNSKLIKCAPDCETCQHNPTIKPAYTGVS